ncbi:ribose transport system permease protein [Kaistia hirudinis]|uniref:Ribose transport system permease protein n=1 Tax=Kaistia hirudinis TaxID=1293440 RepID=A0A840AU49_9HYPH|nr:ABC transporter permease [Kaistia hirudinis]MBB3931975.1 ribose transport system permease protein [Kaistia hirudinis]
MSALRHPVLRAATRIPPSYVVFIVLLGALWVLKPAMMNPNILGTFARQVVPLGIVVLGQLLVISSRSIDLSAGGVILLVNYLISSGLLGGIDPLAVIGICLLIGLAVGSVNGFLVGKRRASAVIVTLAVSIVLIGLVEYLANGKPPGDVPAFFRNLYNARPAGVPAPLIFWVGLAIAMSLVLSRSVFGRFVASIGSNPVSAHFSGVPVERTVVAAHIIAGFMSALAGLVQTASIAVGSVRFGPELVMNSIAATILGGVIFGRGAGVWGPFVGVLCFALLFVVMTSLGIQEPGKLVVQGCIILLAAVFYGVRTKVN